MSECCICYEKRPDWIMHPCLHECCANCYSRLRNKSECFYCRLEVRDARAGVETHVFYRFSNILRRAYDTCVNIGNILGSPIYRLPRKSER